MTAMKYKHLRFGLLPVFVALILLCGPRGLAQSWQWARGGGGAGYDNATKVATDASGNVFVVGYFSSDAMSFDTITLNNSGSGSTDFYVTKYDAAGNVLWAKSAGGTGNDFAGAVTSDNAGNVYVAGYFESSVLAIDTFLLTNAGIGNIFLLKLDPAGNVVWLKQGLGGNEDIPNALHTMQSGNILMAGYMQSGPLQFDAVVLNNVTGSGQAFFAEFAPDGTAVLARVSEGDGSNNARSITSDALGNIFVAGWFDGTYVKFDTTSLTNGGPEKENFFIVRYDPSVNLVWAKTSTNNYDDLATGIATDDSGHIYVAGNYSDTMVFDGTTLISNGVVNMFLTKLDTAGTYLWALSEGGNASDNVQALSIDIYDNIYVSGYFSSASIHFGSLTIHNAGNNDVFFARFNNQGHVYGATAAGGSFDDFGQSLASDATGHVYMAGSYESPTISFSGNTLNNAGLYSGTMDVFLAKYYDPLVEVPVATRVASGIRLYPNPASTAIRIDGLSGGGNSIEIYNCLGARVCHLNATDLAAATSTLLDISTYPAGVYMARILSGQNDTELPFVVVR